MVKSGVLIYLSPRRRAGRRDAGAGSAAVLPAAHRRGGEMIFRDPFHSLKFCDAGSYAGPTLIFLGRFICTASASPTATSNPRTCCWTSEVGGHHLSPHSPFNFQSQFGFLIGVSRLRQPEDLGFRPGHCVQAQRAGAAAQQDVRDAALRGPRAAAAPRVPRRARGCLGVRRGAHRHAGRRWGL